MRVANLDGRLVLLSGTGAVDVERASAGRFGPDPRTAYDRWDAFAAWAGGVSGPAEPYDPADLRAPVPAPRQVFGIGLNYHAHAAESGLEVPERPVVFTKFPSCVTGPYGDIVLPEGGSTDWEAELVAVIGRTARRVAEKDAWSHVAGLTAGQDLSERGTQLAGPAPQFSLGKSLPGFGPTGPCVVTVDEFDDPDDLALGCSVGGEEMQRGRTGDMIFSVPRLVAALSAVLPLLPGDLLFTGTPAGVGMGRSPRRWLAPGDELVTRVETIGEMRHRLVAG
ncbi:fumarylacetoacetate hydrolase family protein [Actinomadura viridis]|uniref:2-keto-4-pentenoate hydratase/2-oxohepta-3-ene-1,7-dioic acid hydratase in catechol pathway n=1 Tax=Actinomadura viridis TaxID=58110 RepID=A0A931DSV6_9ACTN|nr:fumarylacetoacetate hydrolase family protein [Actinomadura viridis]MBG6092865.1 2-keto-4-pentenoate hydratase/2-oxohepta-3-ene-1,7-dioic acid hydratase in catechol pathway [Actinomadura viridis]